MKKWKRILCGVLAGMMAFALPVQAEVNLGAKYEIATNELSSWPQASDIMAETGVLMEASTGAILYDKGADELRYPASITKLMTLLVAAEHGNLKDQVVFTETGIRDVSPDSGNIGMQLGEVLTLEQCLYAMILYSANEVAAQIAEYIGGTEAKFIEMMNDKARALGCENTNFMNASGLPDSMQVTTARDMALIFRAGLRNKVFRKIVKTREYSIPETNKNNGRRPLATHHPLLSKQSSIFDPACIGGKSGMTNDAGYTLVTGMKKDGMTLIAVVMKDVDLNQAGADSRDLFQYGFENFKKQEVEGGTIVLPKEIEMDTLDVREREDGENMQQRYYLDRHFLGKGLVEKMEVTEAPEDAAVTARSEQTGTQKEAEASGKNASEPSGTELKESEDSENPEAAEEPREKGLSDLAKRLLLIMAGMLLLLAVLCMLLVAKLRKR